MGIVGLCLLGERYGGGLHGRFGDLFLVFGLLVVLQGGFIGFLDHRGDIGHANEESDAESPRGKFFLEVHGPISIFEVVVLGGGERLDVAVSAVVVGDDKPLVGYHLSGASASEVDDGVLERGVVDAVDLFGGEAAAKLRHGARVHLLEKREEPHAFVRAGAGGERKGRREGQEGFFQKGFHIVSNNVGSSSFGWKLRLW